MALLIFEGSGTGPVLRGPNTLDVNFTLSTIEIDTVVSGGTTVQNTVKDRVFNVTTGGIVNQAGQVLVNNLVSGTALTPVFTCLDTAYATVDSFSGVVSYLANGWPQILVNTPFLSKIIRMYCNQELSGTVTQFVNYVSGSLAAEMSSEVDTRLAVGGASAQMFSTVNNATSTYARNPNCWLNGIDLSGLCIYNSTFNTAEGGGTVITPLHVIMAAHYNSSYTIGGTLRFLGTDGSVNNRTIVSAVTISGGSYNTDIELITLNAPLPSVVSVVPILPANYANYLGNINSYQGYPGVPGFWMNQYLQTIVSEVGQILTGGLNADSVDCIYPSTPLRQAFSGGLVVGDSGHGFYWIVNGALVFLCPAHTGGINPTGANVNEYMTQINTAISGSGYSLTTVNISAFPTY